MFWKEQLSFKKENKKTQHNQPANQKQANKQKILQTEQGFSLQEKTDKTNKQTNKRQKCICSKKPKNLYVPIQMLLGCQRPV